jgi:methionine-gamma-lyase
MADKPGIQTTVVHASQGLNTTSAISPPIWQTTTFSSQSAEDFAEIAVRIKPREFYTRYGNPTHALVEATIAALEEGEAALVTGSGMGAIFAAVVSQLRSGDHVVCQRNHYAATVTLFTEVLEKWGISCTAVDQTDIHEFEQAIRSNTRMIYVETPTNPLMQLTDLKRIAEIGRSRGITTIVDNTFGTPVNQRPLTLGIDVVVHSATKFLSGHHDVTAGVIVGSREMIERIWMFAIVAGAALSPFDSWLLLRGLRTLALRVERHNSNALSLARFLEGSPKVERVYYPGLESHPQHELAQQQMSGFTGVLSVELKGGFAHAESLMENLKLATRGASLGGFETLVVHPAAMWGLQLSPEQRRAAGLSEGLVRISVGLEDEEDLVRDFARSIDSV